jgi:urea transport system substrate-binding protein
MTPDKKQTILIVEDDDGILFTVTESLTSDGFNTREANNGLVALNTIEKDGLPDLILLDMKMPVMDGWTFAAEFRKRYGNKTPIVVMTAAGDASKRAMEIDANGWISKPFSLERLQNAIKTILKTAVTQS